MRHARLVLLAVLAGLSACWMAVALTSLGATEPAREPGLRPWVEVSPSADDTNGCSDVFLHDQLSRQTICLSRQGDGHSFNPTISADGARVAFASLATSLDGRRAPAGQIYVWERTNGRVRRVALEGLRP